MKVFVPERRVDAPELSEEQVSKLISGMYVEGDFGLEEGDVFPLASEGIPFEAVCYRITDSGRQRLRLLSGRERELSETLYHMQGDRVRGMRTWC